MLELDGEDLHALDKLSELYLKLGAGKTAAAYAKKADIVVLARREEGASTPRSARSTSASSNDPARAIDTYQRILEVDPDDRSAIGRLDALYLATENWTELMSVLEREVDLTGDPDESVGYRYRIAELWDQKLNDSHARGRRLPRDPGAARPTTSRRWSRSRA